ncbi:MAG TPA: hypothetical protein VK762_08025, partial [Polyangiaceae bacterium]|nr:hypothetical protein [Polyangiaceae bacterium]
MNAAGLAALICCAAPLLALVAYAPALQAPFLVPKFAVLEISGALGWLAFLLQRVLMGQPRWSRAAAVGAWLVIATTLASWIAALGREPGAPYALDAFARSASCLGLACGASVIAGDGDARQRVLEAVTTAAGAVAAVGILQHFEWSPLVIPVISTPGSTFGNRNFAAETMAMALPLGVGAATGARRRGTGAVACALGASLALQLVFLAITRTR